MIRSSFAAFMTARSGVMSSQMALSVTGNNMANVNTDGYSRQRLDMVSMNSGVYASRYAYSSKAVGQGVYTQGVSQYRDQFVDARFRHECASLGYIDTTHGILRDLESVMDEWAKGGLTDQLADLVAKLTVLGEYAGQPEYDGMVRSSADLLCKLFNSYAKDIATIRENENLQLDEIDIPRVNQIFEQLDALNTAIRKQQQGGNPALELKDQRNLLLDELSNYMDIRVTYTPDKYGVEDVKIELVVPGGTNVALMENNEYVTFRTDFDSSGKKQILIDTYDNPSVVNDLTGKFGSGVFKGVLDMLNENGEYDVPISSIRGIGYYEGLLDTLASQFAEILNDANRVPNPAYVPGVSPPADEFLDRPLFEPINSADPISASNIKIAEAWLRNDYGVTNTRQENGSDTAQDNIQRIISLFSDKHTFTNPNGDALFTGSFAEYFGNICSIVGQETEKAAALAKSAAIVANTTLDLREAISQVSLDEEAINMLMFQKSLNASSRLMTTLDEALDVVINRMGVVGR